MERVKRRHGFARRRPLASRAAAQKPPRLSARRGAIHARPQLQIALRQLLPARDVRDRVKGHLRAVRG